MKISLPKKILIASNNEGKLKEISQLLRQAGIEDIFPSSLLAFKNLQEPEENGENFEQNSLIKAKYYALQSGLAALADDSGLCIDALDGAPSIHSARFALDKNGKKNFPATFEKIFKMLENKGFSIDKNKISAHFICNLTLFDPSSNFSISFEGRVDGKLVRPCGSRGFGYDPIFIKNGMTKSFGEISAQKKDKISHRAMAFEKFLDWAENFA